MNPKALAHALAPWSAVVLHRFGWGHGLPSDVLESQGHPGAKTKTPEYPAPDNHLQRWKEGKLR